MTRRVLCVATTLITVILVGTVVVLSTVVAYFGVQPLDVITVPEMERYQSYTALDHSNISMRGSMVLDSLGIPAVSVQSVADAVAWDPTQDGYRKFSANDPQVASDAAIGVSDVIRRKIPKLVHQTWKTAQLPEKWERIRQDCMAMHSD